MVHSYGYKAGTRHMFQKKFRCHGNPSPASTLQRLKVGDYVDVVANPSVRKGMPHKIYHGKTGIVWNVTPRGVGVILNKRNRTRIMRKRVCLRFEHVRASECRKDLKAKAAAYVAYKKAVKEGKAPKLATNSARAAKMVRKPTVVQLKREIEDYTSRLPY